jgi:hypothetical protein
MTIPSYDKVVVCVVGESSVVNFQMKIEKKTAIIELGESQLYIILSLVVCFVTFQQYFSLLSS